MYSPVYAVEVQRPPRARHEALALRVLLRRGRLAAPRPLPVAAGDVVGDLVVLREDEQDLGCLIRDLRRETEVT